MPCRGARRRVPRAPDARGATTHGVGDSGLSSRMGRDRWHRWMGRNVAETDERLQGAGLVRVSSKLNHYAAWVAAVHAQRRRLLCLGVGIGIDY